MESIEKYQGHQTVQEITQFEDSDKIEFDSILNIIKPVLRRWYIVPITILIICAIGIPPIWFLSKPVYSTIGAIEVAPLVTNILTGEDDRAGVSNYLAFMNTQAKIMMSNKVLERVADDLKDKNLQFFGDKSDPMIGLKAALAYGTIIIAPAPGSQWLEITMANQNPKEAEQIINAFIRAYMAVIGTSSIQGTNQRLALLENERKVTLTKLQRQRQLIHSLAEEYGTASLEDRQKMMLKKVMAIQTELINLEIRKMNLQMQTELLSHQKTKSIPSKEKRNMTMIDMAKFINTKSTFINNDLFVSELVTDILRLRQEYLEDQHRLAPTNPVLEEKAELIEEMEIILEKRKEELSKSFDETMAKELDLTGEYKLPEIKAELKKIESLEKTYKARLAQEDQQAIKVGRLQLRIEELLQQMALTQELYDRISQRIHEVEMELKRSARISVADYASTGPPKNRRKKLAAALIFMATAFGMFLAFLRDRTDPSLYTPDDVTKRIGVQIIGTTTREDDLKKSYLFQQITDDYQTILTNLTLLEEGNIPHKLVITSAGVRDGKTTFAINLSTSLAKLGKRVLLIDGDLRKPDIRRLLRLPKNPRGIPDVFSDKNLKDAVHFVPSTSLDILPAEPCNPSRIYKLINQERTAAFINDVSKEYDHVIIDSPPVLAAPDALLWAKMADAVVLTCFAGHTETNALKQALERLTQVNIKVLGTVLNNVRFNYAYNYYRYKYYTNNSDTKAKSRKIRKNTLLLPMQKQNETSDTCASS